MAACKLPGFQLQIRSKAFHVPLSIRASSDCLHLCDFLCNRHQMDYLRMSKRRKNCNQCQQSTSRPVLYCAPLKDPIVGPWRRNLPPKNTSSFFHSETNSTNQVLHLWRSGGLQANLHKSLHKHNRTYNFNGGVGPCG